MFNFIRTHLSRLYDAVTRKLQALFSRTVIDEDALNHLEEILLSADVGTRTTRALMERVRSEGTQRTLSGEDVKAVLDTELRARLTHATYTEPTNTPWVLLLVGVNGSGKTSSAAKLAAYYKQRGKHILLVAADTFRAAAVDQLAVWGERLSIPVVTGAAQADPASVVYKACATFEEGAYDGMIIDTAGRLQTKQNLMKELEKISSIIAKKLPQCTIHTLLSVDAMLGQNSLSQAHLFHQSTKLDGVILTKMDGTGRGGIIVAIADELHVPVAYITYGETLDALKPFDSTSFIQDMLSA